MDSAYASPIKRVLMTGDTVGGVWSYTLELSRALLRYGIEVHLAVMGKLPSASQREEVKDIPNLRLYESNFKLEWMDDPWQDVELAARWLLTLELLTDPDIVHLNGFVHGAIPWTKPFFIVGHSCVLSWLEATGGSYTDNQWGEYRRQVTRGLQKSLLVVAPTQAMLSALQKFYGSFHKTCVVANGRQEDTFRPGNKEPFVFSAGRLWDKAKNILLLDQVASEIDWPVWVAGDTSHPCGETRAFRNVRCLGKLSQDDIASRLSLASIYVSPARYEPFGLSVLEAALSGCALVLSDIASLRELWGESALYIDADNPVTLRDTLAFLISHPEERKRLSALSRERALTYSSTRMADHYMAIYSTLGSLSRPSGHYAIRKQHCQRVPAGFRSGGRAIGCTGDSL